MVRATRSVIWLCLCMLGIVFAPAALAQSKKKKAGPPPVFNSPVPAPVMFPSQPPQPPTLAPPAPSETYGDWKVIIGDPGTYISTTVNASGSAFGIICAKSCSAFFNPVLPCKNGDKFPALINSPSGAFAVTLDCYNDKEYALLTMTFTKGIYSAMEIGGELGIAFPMESGKFKVARFSLTGAMIAAKRAYNLSAASASAPTGSGLKDQTL